VTGGIDHNGGRAGDQASVVEHSGASPSSQHSVLKRLKRFRVTEDSLWETYINNNGPGSVEKLAFTDRLRKIDRSNEIVTLTSLYIHLVDQADWGLIDHSEAKWAGTLILAQVCQLFGLEDDRAIGSSGEDIVRDMIDAYARVLSEGAVRA
jgi:hypothetical protein